MICHARNYWKWLPEILRHEGSQVVMLTIWIKWLRGCISSFSADISGPGARTTVGTRIKGDPLSVAYSTERKAPALPSPTHLRLVEALGAIRIALHSREPWCHRMFHQR
jgi:hypothetical protein